MCSRTNHLLIRLLDVDSVDPKLKKGQIRRAKKGYSYQDTGMVYVLDVKGLIRTIGLLLDSEYTIIRELESNG